MSAAAAAWLEARHPDAPAGLLARMRLALDHVGAPEDAPVWRALAEAAVERLRAALPHADERAGALDLLTADALLTHACEAAAEEGPAALEALVEEYGADRLATLLGDEG